MTFTPLMPNVRMPGPKEGTVTVFEQYEVASWMPDGGQKIYFPVHSITEYGGSRIIERERPYRDGAKLDDTGRLATYWDMQCQFANTINEPGLEANGEPLYPNMLNWLIDTFDVHATGYLVVPTRGEVRARAEQYQRTETATERDSGMLRITFKEDNEDTVDAASLAFPTVAATAVRLASTTQFSAQAEGMWSMSFQDLVHMAAQLEGLANAPREYAQELKDKANMVRAAHNRVLNAFRNNAVEGRNQLASPGGNRTERKMHQIADRAARASNMAHGGNPGTRAVVFDNDQSLASIAGMLWLNFEDLLYDNPQIPNPGYVPKGTPVNVPENAQIQRHG